MALYHVNPETGNAGPCKAEKGRCRFGSADEHYTTQESAQRSYELKQEAFRAAHKDDLGFYSPLWSGRIPKRLEGQIARAAAKLEAKAIELEAKVGKGPLSALKPKVYPVRPRGYELVKAADVSIYYTGDSQYLLALTSRQGGGNRECYCDDYSFHEDGCTVSNNDLLEAHPQFIAYEDDDTYTTHYYSTDFTTYDLAEMALSEVYGKEAAELRRRLRLLKDGEAPPWSVLAEDDKELVRYNSLKGSKGSKEKDFQETSALLPKFKSLENILSEERPLTPEEIQDFLPLVKSNYYDRGTTFQNAHNDLLKKRASFTAAKARHEQAEQLPPGELREYLLGDRGTGTYRVEEKVGRRKTTVTKTYERGTLLGKELKDEERYYLRAKQSFQNALKPVHELEEAVREKHKKNEENLRELQEAREAAWLNGWPSSFGEPPEPSEFF